MKSKKSSFQGKVAKASKKTAQSNSNYGYLNLSKGVNVFKPESDTSITLDFLPYTVTIKNHPDKDEKDGTAVKDSIWYRLPFKIHRNIGVDNDTAVCPASFGKKCPVCEYKAKKVTEKADKADIDALKASPRYLYVVNPLDSSKYEKGKWHIFDISHAMFQSLLDEELEESNVSEVFMDPTEGESLKIRFKGKTIGNSKPFPEAKKITPVKRAKQYADSIADETPKLDEVLVVLSYEDLEKKFFELEDEEEEEEPRTKKGSKKVVEEPEEEDDDDEEEDEPTPTRNKKKVEPPKKSSKKQEPEEEEEEDDEEEDDDEDPEEEEEEEDENLEWDDIVKMKDAALRDLVKANKLKVKPGDFDDDVKAFRKAVAKALGIDVPKAKAVKEEEEEEPKKKGTTSKASSKGGKDKCPAGYRFGVDTDKKNECDSCDLWEECMEAKKKNK